MHMQFILRAVLAVCTEQLTESFSHATVHTDPTHTRQSGSREPQDAGAQETLLQGGLPPLPLLLTACFAPGY